MRWTTDYNKDTIHRRGQNASIKSERSIQITSRPMGERNVRNDESSQINVSSFDPIAACENREIRTLQPLVSRLVTYFNHSHRKANSQDVYDAAFAEYSEYLASCNVCATCLKPIKIEFDNVARVVIPNEYNVEFVKLTESEREAERAEMLDAVRQDYKRSLSTRYSYTIPKVTYKIKGATQSTYRPSVKRRVPKVSRKLKTDTYHADLKSYWTLLDYPASDDRFGKKYYAYRCGENVFIGCQLSKDRSTVLQWFQFVESGGQIVKIKLSHYAPPSSFRLNNTRCSGIFC